jgi:thioredoxin 1
MALCCIGGVCIPYTAIVPFMILGLKWMFEKLVAAGLIPAAIQEKMNSLLHSNSSSSSGNSKCCTSTTSACNGSSTTTTKLRRGKKTSSTLSSSSSSSSCCNDDDAGPGTMISVKSLDEWNSIVSKNDNNYKRTVICKMTASWCKPCQVIQPIFEELAASIDNKKSAIIFCIVDVDELDEVAAQYRVAMLPTFLVLQPSGGQGRDEVVVVDRYSGSNEQKLRDLVSSATTAAK